MEELKRTLARAYAEGARSKDLLDQLLGQHHADPAADLRTVCGEAGLDALRLLRQRIAEGRLISRAYTRPAGAGREQGCVMYWLFGFRSNADLLAYRYVSQDMLMAFARCTRGWD